jgi:hypothetical protein
MFQTIIVKLQWRCWAYPWIWAIAQLYHEKRVWYTICMNHCPYQQDYTTSWQILSSYDGFVVEPFPATFWGSQNMMGALLKILELIILFVASFIFLYKQSNRQVEQYYYALCTKMNEERDVIDVLKKLFFKWLKLIMHICIWHQYSLDIEFLKNTEMILIEVSLI